MKGLKMKLFLIGLSLLMAAGNIFCDMHISWFLVILPIAIVPIMFFSVIFGLVLREYLKYNKSAKKRR